MPSFENDSFCRLTNVVYKRVSPNLTPSSIRHSFAYKMSPVWTLILHIAFGVAIGAEKCLVPVIENGRARQKGKYARIARFNCRRDFQLLGNKYAHCIRGSWDAEKPVCIKAGCDWIRPKYLNGHFLDSYQGALIKVMCHPGYASPGPSTVYCNGQKWNGTFPSCQPIETNPKKSCDFENDMCGWSNGPENRRGMDWTINIGQTGHFIQSPESKRNRISRLYSPVFGIPAENSSSDACFFYSFHMNGTSGTLKIYVLLEGETLEETIPDVWIYGYQGPAWKTAHFPLNPERQFQIIVEGSGETVLVDDLRIGSYEECYVATETSPPTPSSTEPFTSTDAFDTVDDFSCQGRCMEEAVLIGTDITADQLDETDKCSCSVSCISIGTCCNDFVEYCSTPTPQDLEPTSDEMAYETTSIFHDITTECQQNVTQVVDDDTTNGQGTTYNTREILPETIATRSDRVQNMITLISETTIKHTVAAIVHTVPTTPLARTEATTPTSTRLVRRKGYLPTTSTSQRPSDSPKVATNKQRMTGSKTGLKMGNANSNSIPVLVSDSKDKIHKGTADLPKSWLNGNTLQQAVKSKEKDGAHVGMPLHVIAEAAAGSAVVLLSCAVLIIFLKRRLQTRYQASLVEDSDVRFLTSDEDLDFTLASPTDSEL